MVAIDSNKTVLIDLEKIKDPFSGLGQFCYYLKKEFDQAHLSINYFMPDNKKLFRFFPFLIPHCDIFHAIHQDCPYIPFYKMTKYILTIHDLNAIYEAKNEKEKNKFIRALSIKIKRADIITFISEFTFNETKKYFNLKDKKTVIIYNGISLPDFSQIPKYQSNKPFLFSIGTVLPKKNFHVLIDMMKELPDFELIIAGTTFHPYAKEILNKINDEKLFDRIHLVGTISNEEKKWYYENAKAFVFPSLFEGFGLPIAEAMAHGLPLFLSDKTSIPEIGGPDAYYFKSFNSSEMAETIKIGLDNFSEAKKIKLIEHSQKFNWKNAAEKYLEIYKSL